MSDEKCIYESRCYLDKQICWKFPEYLTKNLSKGCLYAHIFACLEQLEKFLPRYIICYQRLLSRVAEERINAKLAERLIKAMIILHDYGKASEQYVRLTGKIYYHEVLSGYVTFNVIENILRQQTYGRKAVESIASIFAMATFMHHEHRIVRIARRMMTPDILARIIRRITPTKITVRDEANRAFNKIMQKEIGISIKSILKKEYNIGEVEYTYGTRIRGLLLRLHVSNIKKISRIYMGTVALNHILIITDIRAANKTRDKKAISRYFGTILTKGRGSEIIWEDFREKL